jgi:hypothetical protein
MLNDEEIKRALANIDKVRGVHRVPFLSVKADPNCADNVMLRMPGRNRPWRTMHVATALDHVAILRRRLMQQRVARYSR